MDECVLLIPSKAFGGHRKAPPLAQRGRNWLPLQTMISPPQKRVRWSFLNQDGKRMGKVAGQKEKEEVRRVLPFVEIKGNS